MTLLGGIYSVYYNYPEKIKKTFYQSLQNLGFSLKEVIVFGRYRSSQEEILQTLHVTKGQFLFDCSLYEMQKKLMMLEWIKDVSIHRSLCGALYVYITEREPIALYHDEKSKTFYLVDKEGTLINKPIAPCFRGLPVLSGVNAEKNAFAILQQLNQFKYIRSKISSMVFIHERRWNLRLHNKVEVKLPERNISQALKVLSILIKQEKTSSGDISVIDLRLENRIILKLSNTGKIYFRTFRGSQKI